MVFITNLNEDTHKSIFHICYYPAYMYSHCHISVHIISNTFTFSFKMLNAIHNLYT